jgi:hypothetical protein
MEVDGGTPVTLGADRFTYWFNRSDRRLNLSTTGLNPVRYPASAPDFWLSGYAEGQEGLQGSAGLVEETMGDGRVILFSGEPNYRAYTEGSAFFLANAIAYPAPATAPRTTDVASPRARDDVEEAQRGTDASVRGTDIVLKVPTAAEGRALGALSRFTADVAVERAGTASYLRIPNPQDLTVEEHPFAYRLLPALERAGVQVLAADL